MVEWYNLLIPETRAYIISLLPERPASATLVQCLIERWWDTTHTFHIVGREMTVMLGLVSLNLIV